jgi:guanylate kinase
MSGRPVVFVGPSGIGKNTIIGKLMDLYPDRFAFSVSHTTREGEVNGSNYHFVTREEFERDLAENKFREHALVHGNSYGTSFDAIQAVEQTGKICFIDVNIDGAIVVANSRLKPFIIFLRPESIRSLERRLRARGTESEESIKKRMATATEEMRRFEENKGIWNLVIINDRIDATLVKISAELFKRYPLP